MRRTPEGMRPVIHEAEQDAEEFDVQRAVDTLRQLPSPYATWEGSHTFSDALRKIPEPLRTNSDVVHAAREYLEMVLKGNDSMDADRQLSHYCYLWGAETVLLAFPMLKADAEMRKMVTAAVRECLVSDENGLEDIGSALASCIDPDIDDQVAIDAWARENFLAALNTNGARGSSLYSRATHTEELDALAKRMVDEGCDKGFDGGTVWLLCSYAPELFTNNTVARWMAAQTVMENFKNLGGFGNYYFPLSVYRALDIDDAYFTDRHTWSYSQFLEGIRNVGVQAPAIYDSSVGFVSPKLLHEAEETVLMYCASGNVPGYSLVDFKVLMKVFHPSAEFLARPEIVAVLAKTEKEKKKGGWGYGGGASWAGANKYEHAQAASWGKDGHYDIDGDVHWTPTPEKKQSRFAREDSPGEVFTCFLGNNVKEGIAMAKRLGMQQNLIREMVAEDDKVRSAFESYEEKTAAQHRYAELGDLLRMTGREMPITGEGLGKVLKKLMNDGMPTAAAECLKIADEHHVAMDDEVLRGKITLAAEQEQERRKKREPREIPRSREIPKAAHQLAAFFYVESRVLQNVDLVLQEIPYDAIDLPFATNLRLREFQSDLRRDIEMVSLRLREYLMVACASEIRHQDQLRDGQSDVAFPSVLAHGGYPDAKAVFRLGTDEENITYLAQAEARFLEEGWYESYGGKKWAVIAETGMRLFRHPDDVTIMDYVFDLEHNTKAIFDKDESIIEQDTRAMEALKTGEVLNAKRYAKGNSRQLIRVLREVLPKDHALFDRLDRVVDRWMDVLRAIERSYAARGKEWKVEKYI